MKIKQLIGQDGNYRFSPIVHEFVLGGLIKTWLNIPPTYLQLNAKSSTKALIIDALGGFLPHFGGLLQYVRSKPLIKPIAASYWVALSFKNLY